MKKVLTMLLAAVLVLLLAACSTPNPEVPDPGTNADTGNKTENNTPDGSNTDTTPKHEHSWGDWQTTKEANCTEAGEQARSCTTCDASETRTVAALKHSYNSQNVCTRCGKYRYGTRGLSFAFDNNSGGYKVTLGTATDTDIVIPEEYNNKPVTVIPSDAFKNSAITSVFIPKSIKTIDYTAFLNCTALTEVTFEKDGELRILQGFKGCTSLASVTVPSFVTQVNPGAFSGCTSLTSLRFEETSGWVKAYWNNPRDQEMNTNVSNASANANMYKIEGNQWYFWRMV